MTKWRWTLSWAVCIAVMSLVPSSTIERWNWDQLFQFDKLAHAAVYGLLFVLFFIESGQTRNTGLTALKPLMLFAFYGILLEFLQCAMYMGRHFDVLDIIANIIGLIAAAIVAPKVFK